MINTPDMTRLAAALGDATRIRMLTLLMEGRALTAKELAYGAGVEPSTATAHLNRLARERFVRSVEQGRHKYFRLASPEVAHLIETLMVLAPRLEVPEPAGTQPIRRARFCYDHLAGRLGIALADALLARGILRAADDAYAVTERGEAWFRALGIPLAELRRRRRRFAYPCLDWTERKHHLAGALGAALARRMTALGWTKRSRNSRVVSLTPAGERALANKLGITLPD